MVNKKCRPRCAREKRVVLLSGNGNRDLSFIGGTEAEKSTKFRSESQSGTVATEQKGKIDRRTTRGQGKAKEDVIPFRGKLRYAEKEDTWAYLACGEKAGVWTCN